MGGLVRALQSFQDLGINVQHIESRPSQTADSQVDFLVDVETDTKKLEQLGRMLKVGGIFPLQWQLAVKLFSDRNIYNDHKR